MTAYIACPETPDQDEWPRAAEHKHATSMSFAGPDLVSTRIPAHGALSRPDALRLLGPDVVESPDWAEIWPGVIVPARRTQDPLTRAAAALLRAGPYSVLSGATAVAMHGCSAAAESEIHVTVPYDRQTRCLPGLTIRQAWVRESEVVELDGLRVHALDVALAELLCCGPQRVALACLEQALAQLGGNAERFRSLIAERIARKRDRRGTRQAAALLRLAWADPPGVVSREAELGPYSNVSDATIKRR